MTNKEAIKWLNKNRPCISMTCNKENADNINSAIDLAINALENIETFKNAYKIMSDAFEHEVRKHERPRGDTE